VGWRVEVDADQCQLSGLCTAMAPDHLMIADNGRPRPRQQEDEFLVGDTPEEINDAVECCPTGALSIVERSQRA